MLSWQFHRMKDISLTNQTWSPTSSAHNSDLPPFISSVLTHYSLFSWWYSSKNIIQKPGFWLLMRALGNSTINYCFPLLSSPLPFMMNPSLHCLPVLNWRTKLPVGFLCFSRDTPPMSFVGVSVKSQPWGKHLTIWVPFILLYSSILLEIWFILNFTWKKKKRANLLDFFFWFRWSLGEGNGTPLQYCCPENPMDGGAW